MLYEIHLLFKQLSGNKKSKGAFNHVRFIKALKASNALFDNDEGAKATLKLGVVCLRISIASLYVSGPYCTLRPENVI